MDWKRSAAAVSSLLVIGCISACASSGGSSIASPPPGGTLVPYVSPGATLNGAGRANGWPSESAMMADTFVDSIGINTHFTYDHTPYVTQFSQVEALLLASGVRHLRDNLSTSSQFVPLMVKLGQDGIRVNYVVPNTASADDVTSYPAIVTPSLESFEGPNEQDDDGNSNWVGGAVRFQKNLYSWVKNNSATAHYPVYGLSMAWPHDFAKLGDMDPYEDYGNLHDYMADYNPGCACGPWGGVAKMLTDESAQGSKPVVATEAGYATVGGTNGMNDKEELRYVTRLFFEQILAGIKRTYDFTFIDQSDLGDFSTYGLVTSTLTPKPGYTGIKSLIAALADPGPTFTPGALSYTLAGATPAVHHLLMQRRNGTFILALWQEVAGWNVAQGNDSIIAAVPITLTTANTYHVSTVHMYENGTTSTSAATSTNSTPVNVSDKITLVTLAP